MRKSGRKPYTCVLLALLATSSSALAQMNAGNAKAKAKLIASVDAVAPGEKFDLAVAFDIQANWHIYWAHSGDSGYPPAMKWTEVPDGFSIGEFQFPVPKRHPEPGGFVTNILEHDPVLVMTVTAPTTIKSSKAAFKGKLNFLVCEKNCLPGTYDFTLELPVKSSAADVKPANADVFDRAKRNQPKKESKHLKVLPSVSPAELARGQMPEVVLNLDISPGFKIQSNKPLQPEFIATDVFTQPTKGMIFKPAEFPAHKVRNMPGLGDIAEFAGKVEVRIPAEFTGEELTCPVRFGGVVTFQACDAKGICSPPDAVQFALAVPCSQVQGTVVPEHPTPTGGTAAPDSAAPPTTTLPSSSEKPSPGATTPAPPQRWVDRMIENRWGVLLIAFIGGLILNIMPCVLPVISIKVLSFVQQADEEPGRVFRLGMTFAAGIILSFLALAVIIISLKHAGSQLGWGFQFQSPTFVVVMTAIVFLFGLSLFGVFEITLPGAAFTQLSAAEQREGYAGAFMKGLLGTVLATPCTAPFLGPALGVAFKSDDAKLAAIFTAVGLGMAAPFVLLTLNPRWLRLLPKPGNWMITFKQLMGFLLMGTVIWLAVPLGTQIGAEGLLWTLVFLVFVAAGAWLLGKVTPLTPARNRASLWLTAVAMIVVGWWFSFSGSRSMAALVAAERERANGNCQPVDEVDCGHFAGQLPAAPWKDIPWQRWQKNLPERLAECGYTVYVDFTAAWCATCLTNKKVFLETDAVRGKMADLCLIPFKADFTSEDPNILEVLQRFGRSGVPLNVIYPAGKPDQPIVMPEFLGSTDYVVAQLEEAGKSVSACPNHAPMLSAGH